MDPKIFEAVSASVKHVLETMTMTKVTLGEPLRKDSKDRRGMHGSVTGFIGLAGGNSNGTLSLSFEDGCLFNMLENMLSEKFTSVTEDVLDAVGEITNIVCGDLKRRLSESGYEIGLATPLVIHGKPVQIRDRVTRDTYVMVCSTPAGTFAVESNLAKV